MYKINGMLNQQVLISLPRTIKSHHLRGFVVAKISITVRDFREFWQRFRQFFVKVFGQEYRIVKILFIVCAQVIELVTVQRTQNERVNFRIFHKSISLLNITNISKTKQRQPRDVQP